MILFEESERKLVERVCSGRAGERDLCKEGIVISSSERDLVEEVSAILRAE